MLIGTVFDAMCFARPLFQRAARRMAHCLFVVALHGWICLCFRRVVASFRVSASVSSERSVIAVIFHGCGTVGVTLHVAQFRGF